MNLAAVIGRTTATVKHPSLNGWRMLIVQPLTSSGGNDGPPMIAIDNMGSGIGDEVIITSDGKAVREALNTNNSPVRWMVIGQKDQ
ncbi:Ethanolamine utilization protein EutN [Maioricimonas rarisocia]|uniref:Ethanolamine utilization protein EutN n=1 Tax=Maioricimonas rarisocia TaxID=2528026 RepID=A0A517ZAA1_9PLAN|nr:EutN/CcmL family microcompartment protein [Maioricimonas rarisocia]QDU39417.1 Ethanolamine utilization protein EutN [Maioricimonas rarisocia]